MQEDRLTTYTILPAVRIEEMTGKARGLLEALERWTIATPGEADTAGLLRADVHEQIKELGKLRLETGKPAREAQKDINAFFEPPLAAYKKAKGLLGQMLNAYQAKAEAEAQAALVEASKGNVEALALAVPPPPVAGVSYRDRIKVVILDIDKVPRQFMTVDWSALNLLAKSGAPAPEGVEFQRVSEAAVGR